jgi:uncharacterized membrane protein YwzB
MEIFLLFIAAILLFFCIALTFLVIQGVRTLFISKGNAEFHTVLILISLTAIGFGLASYALVDLANRLA